VDVETRREYTFGPDQLQEGVDLLMQADTLIGANIIRFDLPAIQKFFPDFSWEGITIRDTAIMSRMAFPKRYQHSLRSWGDSLGISKGDYAEDFKLAAGDSYTEGAEWKQWSPEMQEYCTQDCRVTRRIYMKCLHQMPRMFDDKALELEQYTTRLMEMQKKAGVGFNKEKATELMLTLMDHRDRLAEEIRKSFKGFFKKGKEFTPKRDNKRLGYIKGSTVTKIIWCDFNPGSRDHIIYWLKKKYNWQPVEFTDSGKPKICETILEDLASVYPEAGPLAEHFMVCKRLSALSEGKGSWFNNLTSENRIHGSVNAQGTVTYRGTHNNPNLGQIPKVGKPYGAECRDLFSHGMGDGWSFMGCDMSGIEFRLLAHYLHRFDGGDLRDTVLHGDIHSSNQKAAGLPTRDMAKTFIYAFIYGGGDAKLGSIVGKGLKEGGILRARFLKGMPAIATLLSRLTAYRSSDVSTDVTSQ
jgi:DNA polymerase I-like protein with 3'-5' exonuclease and polymerase domains